MSQTLFNRFSKYLATVLLLELILGLIDLSIEFPPEAGYANSWLFVFGQPFILLHLILATIIIIGATSLLVRSIVSHHRAWVIQAGLGWAFVGLAFLSGERFVATQADQYSVLMTFGFLGAIIVYIVGSFWSGQSAQPNPK